MMKSTYTTGEIWEGVESKVIHESGDLPNSTRVTFGGKEKLIIILFDTSISSIPNLFQVRDFYFPLYRSPDLGIKEYSFKNKCEVIL